MSMFGNLTNTGLEESEDRLGGSFVKDTDVYEGIIKVAYGVESRGGAKGVVLNIMIGGQEYRETQWVTNKKGENFFYNKDDKTKKVPLPGFTTVEDICFVTTEKGLAEQDVEEKAVNIWDSELKKEVPKNVPVLVELTGKKLWLAIVKNKENKTKDDGNGNYLPIPGEFRDTNNIEKVFEHNTRMTVPEARAKKTEGEFIEKWLERNKGQVRDKTAKDGASTAKPGTAAKPGANAAAPAARTSLFAKK